MNFFLSNKSDRLTDVQVQAIADAGQTQLRLHVCPIWNLDPNQVSVGVGDVIPADAIPVYLTDGSDPGMYGYHNLGGIQIFAAGILNARSEVLSGSNSVSAVVSHELCETLVDPTAESWIDGYALEICDPVQEGFYEINGVSVSDFVFPRWFDSESTQGPKLNYLGTLTHARQLAPGGYQVVTKPDGSTDQLFAAIAPQPWRLAVTTRARKRLGHKGAK